MRYRNPNREVTEGETIRLVLDLAPAAGANSITSVDYECSDLTFTNDSFSGTSSSAFVSGGQAGRDYTVTTTIVLSSGETKVGAFVLEWKEPGYEFRTGLR